MCVIFVTGSTRCGYGMCQLDTMYYIEHNSIGDSKVDVVNRECHTISLPIEIH